ncbi:MAG: prephenate/arogenate dehydrogenase family protein [Pseudomonadota bacterium]
MPVKHLALIGCGLIGSSIARAARQFSAADIISIYDSNETVRQRARELKLADRITDTAADAVKDADLVIFCVPVGAYDAVCQSVAGALKADAVVSDVGSVKTSVADVFRKHLQGKAAYVPAHPVAGTEYSGPDAGFAELFQKRWCILTPDNATPEAATTRVRSFWEGIGAHVDVMSAEHHDSVLAITSHIPHLIAYNIVGTAHHLQEVTQMEVIKYSAGGFRDFTRIASSDPTMWRDIFLNNKTAVLDMLGRFLDDLSKLQSAIKDNDGDALHEHFARTRAIRSAIVAAGQETPKPDFGRQ